MLSGGGGLDVGGHAVIGLSEPRENRTFAGLPLRDRLADAKIEPRCGLYVIDLKTGDVALAPDRGHRLGTL